MHGYVKRTVPQIEETTPSNSRFARLLYSALTNFDMMLPDERPPTRRCRRADVPRVMSLQICICKLITRRQSSGT
jgi:hypothetical protein